MSGHSANGAISWDTKVGKLLSRAPTLASGERTWAHRWRVNRWFLIVAGALLAAAAGVTALPADIAAWVSPALAFGSAAVTGLTAAMQPTKHADDHCLRAAQYEVIQVDGDLFSDLAPTLTQEQCEERFKAIEDRWLKLTGAPTA